MYENIVKQLKKLNNRAIANGDVPVSCIITKNNEIISSAYNRKIKDCDPLAHAEILAIKKAAKKMHSWNLNDCTIFVTLFPCPMCLNIINEARIKKIYYILENKKNINNTTIIKKIDTVEENYFNKELRGFFYDKR